MGDCPQWDAKSGMPEDVDEYFETAVDIVLAGIAARVVSGVKG